MSKTDIKLFTNTSQELGAQLLGLLICPPALLFLVNYPFNKFAYVVLAILSIFTALFCAASIGSIESYLNSRWRKLEPKEYVIEEIKRIRKKMRDWDSLLIEKNKTFLNGPAFTAFGFLNLVCWGIYAYLGVGSLIVFQVFFLPFLVKAAVVWNPRMKVFGMRNMPDWFWDEIEASEAHIKKMLEAEVL